MVDIASLRPFGFHTYDNYVEVFVCLEVYFAQSAKKGNKPAILSYNEETGDLKFTDPTNIILYNIADDIFNGYLEERKDRYARISVRFSDVNDVALPLIQPGRIYEGKVTDMEKARQRVHEEFERIVTRRLKWRQNGWEMTNPMYDISGIPIHEAFDSSNTFDIWLNEIKLLAPGANLTGSLRPAVYDAILGIVTRTSRAVQKAVGETEPKEKYVAVFKGVGNFTTKILDGCMKPMRRNPRYYDIVNDQLHSFLMTFVIRSTHPHLRFEIRDMI